MTSIAVTPLSAPPPAPACSVTGPERLPLSDRVCDRSALPVIWNRNRRSALPMSCTAMSLPVSGA